MSRIRSIVVLGMLAATLSSCAAVEPSGGVTDPADLRFSGNRALEIVTDFVDRFPDRDSTEPNAEHAAVWLEEQFADLGLDCGIDRWEIVNFSRPVDLRNVICTLRGASEREVVLAAHFDQSPATIQGADNDGSGIGILMHLAEIFSGEDPPPHTLVFLADDGEEWGMLGTRRYVQTHPDPERIIAGISLDNVGKELYDGVWMDARGQFRGYGALWFQRLAHDAGSDAAIPWVPEFSAPLFQILEQAVPISFMDEGPFVAAGIPAFGFAGTPRPGTEETHWETYHTAADVIGIQSAETLGNVGLATEATVRRLLSTEVFPTESGPYVYNTGSQRVLRGVPLWALFVAFIALFAVAGILAARRAGSYRSALSHFLALWIPMLASVALLYGFVAVGLMDEYHLYPATAKDPALSDPKWLAVVLWIVALAGMLYAGRRIAARFNDPGDTAHPAAIRAVAFAAVTAAMIYLAAINPFSLVLILPLVAWLGIAGRGGGRRARDIALFLLGGLVLYALLYFFGFVILRIGPYVFWYIMMMFSIGMVSIVTAAAISAMIAAGLSMVVTPPTRRA